MEPVIMITTANNKHEYREFLWNSMPEEARKRAVIVYQQAAANEITRDSNGQFSVHLTNNLFEYGAWLAATQLIAASFVDRNEWFLMIHDSCAFSSDTFAKISEIAGMLMNTNIVFYSLAWNGYHNICLVRKEGVMRIGRYMAEKGSMTKDEAYALEGKGLVDILGDRSKYGQDFRGTHHTEHIVFNDDTRRIVRIQSCNLYKFYKERDGI